VLLKNATYVQNGVRVGLNNRLISEQNYIAIRIKRSARLDLSMSLLPHVPRRETRHLRVVTPLSLAD